MKIVWTRRAVLNLHQIRDFIRRDNPAAAAKVGARIEAAAEGLGRHPESGRVGDVAGTRELMLPGLPYFLVYRLWDGRIEILRILHGRQKWPTS